MSFRPADLGHFKSYLGPVSGSTSRLRSQGPIPVWLGPPERPILEHVDPNLLLPPHELGAWGERLAGARLERRGWTILERNYRLGRREVDLIARKEGILAFVEVKTRSGAHFGPPEASVTWRKRREIETVARDFILRHPVGDLVIRFDVVAIVVGRGRRLLRYEHIEDAWRP